MAIMQPAAEYLQQKFGIEYLQQKFGIESVGHGRSENGVATLKMVWQLSSGSIWKHCDFQTATFNEVTLK
ncbi:hypothetical protein AB6D20_027630 (plasmid) [Vibrio splendidus]